MGTLLSSLRRFGTLTVLSLLFVANLGHAVVDAQSSMNMTSKMPQSQCQLSCHPQSTAPLSSLGTELQNHDVDPEPPLAGYEISFGLLSISLVAVALYAKRQLPWQPPDLCVMNCQFRI